MTSNVSNLPPPFPNQALAQSREAGRVPLESQNKPAPRASAEGTSQIKPPALDEGNASSSRTDSGNGQDAGQPNSQHVNIEA